MLVSLQAAVIRLCNLTVPLASSLSPLPSPPNQLLSQSTEPVKPPLGAVNPAPSLSSWNLLDPLRWRRLRKPRLHQKPMHSSLWMNLVNNSSRNWAAVPSGMVRTFPWRRSPVASSERSSPFPAVPYRQKVEPSTAAAPTALSACAAKLRAPPPLPTSPWCESGLCHGQPRARPPLPPPQRRKLPGRDPQARPARICPVLKAWPLLKLLHFLWFCPVTVPLPHPSSCPLQMKHRYTASVERLSLHQITLRTIWRKPYNSHETCSSDGILDQPKCAWTFLLSKPPCKDGPACWALRSIGLIQDLSWQDKVQGLTVDYAIRGMLVLTHSACYCC